MMKTPLIGTALVFVLLIVSTPSAQEAYDSDSIYLNTDSIFNELSLDGSIVTAWDTTGIQWHYDFDLEDWFPGPSDETIQGQNRETELADLESSSIEERCTEPVEVELFSKRAVTIGNDEYVKDDIEVLGRVTVKGWVQGDIRSHRGRVLVTSSGRVDGHIIAPKIKIQEGAVVLGSVVEDDSLEFGDLKVPFSPDGLIVAISFTIFMLLASFLAISLAPNQVRRVSECIDNHRAKSFSIGFLLILFMPLIFTIVGITIVGLITLPIIPLLYLAAAVFGTISFGSLLGERITTRFSISGHSATYRSLLGIFAFMSLWIVSASLMGSGSHVSQGFGILFLVISIIVSIYPVATGVGATLFTRFGSRDYTGRPKGVSASIASGAPTPAPPPIPDPPPAPPPVAPPPIHPDETLKQDIRINRQDKPGSGESHNEY